ncbi:hypothetical protein [Defluviimonas sp. SAOS-178_SWC]
MKMALKDIRRDPVSPCKDFWHVMRVGAVLTVAVFLITWGVASCLAPQIP